MLDALDSNGTETVPVRVETLIDIHGKRNPAGHQGTRLLQQFRVADCPVDFYRSLSGDLPRSTVGKHALADLNRPRYGNCGRLS